MSGEDYDGGYDDGYDEGLREGHIDPSELAEIFGILIDGNYRMAVTLMARAFQEDQKAAVEALLRKRGLL